jgi:ribosomal protein S27E
MLTDPDKKIVIICGPQSFFLDDVKVNCIDCGSEVFHRPHAPEGVHMCLRCAFKRAVLDPQFVGDIKVTEETIKEVLEEIQMRKTKH